MNVFLDCFIASMSTVFWSTALIESGSNWLDPWEGTTWLHRRCSKVTSFALLGFALLCCAFSSVQQHTQAWAFNPNTALTGSPPLVSMPSGLHLPPLQTLQSPQNSAALWPLCSASFLIPTSITCTGILSQMTFFFFCLFFRCRSLPLNPTLAQFPVGGQHNDQ